MCRGSLAAVPWLGSILRLGSILWLAAGLAVADARAGQTCTDGVDCYCDCVQGANRGDGFVNGACAAKNVVVDPEVLLCEDFEARTLTENIGFGAGAPTFGPWYDHTGSSSGAGRGLNSYWSRVYGPSSGVCAWRLGEPANPSFGVTCGSETCLTDEWSQGNPWNSTAHTCIDIMRAGEFDDELPTNPEPTLPGGGSGIFDGRQIIAHRVPAGDGVGNDSVTVGGIHGSVTFPHPVSTIGFTGALAYPSDVLATHVFEGPWKDNQFGPGIEHWQRGSTGVGTKPDQLPYMPYRWTTSQAACQTALANATLHLGQASCGPNALIYGADPGVYLQSRDFPFGSWGCSQAYMSAMNTSNTTIKLWHDGVLIFHLSGFDGASAFASKTLTDFSWNHYANYNQEVGLATTKTTYRYEDNVHIREGEPVSCQQIGFPP